ESGALDGQTQGGPKPFGDRPGGPVRMVTDSFVLARIPPLHFGPGKLAELPGLAAGFGSEALLITGAKSLEASGRLAAIRDGLDGAGMRIRTLVIDSEPSTRFIDETCASLRPAGIRVVIGIGGGSVIDGAKAISAMLPHTNPVL